MLVFACVCSILASYCRTVLLLLFFFIRPNGYCHCGSVQMWQTANRDAFIDKNKLIEGLLISYSTTSSFPVSDTNELQYNVLHLLLLHG